jgi:hypothetical protein
MHAGPAQEKSANNIKDKRRRVFIKKESVGDLAVNYEAIEL